MQSSAVLKSDHRGIACSLLLHLAVLALWLWWQGQHPPPARPPLNAMLVELVRQPLESVGAAGGARIQAPPRTATAPKVQGAKPDAVQPPVDEVEARIAALATRTATSVLAAPDNGVGGNGNGEGGGYTLADYVRAQILRRWWPQLGKDAAGVMPVALTLKLSRAGVISDVRIVDQQRFADDVQFRGLALSARNAAMLASPIQLPPGQYPTMTDIRITLDPHAVLR